MGTRGHHLDPLVDRDGSITIRRRSATITGAAHQLALRRPRRQLARRAGPLTDVVTRPSRLVRSRRRTALRRDPVGLNTAWEPRRSSISALRRQPAPRSIDASRPIRCWKTRRSRQGARMGAHGLRRLLSRAVGWAGQGACLAGARRRLPPPLPRRIRGSSPAAGSSTSRICSPARFARQRSPAARAVQVPPRAAVGMTRRLARRDLRG